ncbi:MAG: helix-turn-helix domain-containing protein [Clostridia bacterium]|nr:helix-turn-helix domain-containing protein [Clostridia bacterium]
MKKLDFYTICDARHKNIMVKRKAVGDCRDHWHDCCEAELVLSGGGVHVINGVAHEVHPGDFYMFTPSDCHSFVCAETTEVFGVMFDDKYISPVVYARILVEKSRGIDHFVTLDEPHRLIVEELFGALCGEYDRLPVDGVSDLFELYASRLIDALMIELLRNCEQGSETPGLRDSPISAAILYIHSHYSEPITLADAAETVHLSAGYFSELFKSSTGRNFKSYLIDLRIKNACRMLANSELSVTDICYECGFESFSNFMRTFKGRYGISPLKFRVGNRTEKMQ